MNTMSLEPEGGTDLGEDKIEASGISIDGLLVRVRSETRGLGVGVGRGRTDCTRY